MDEKAGIPQKVFYYLRKPNPQKTGKGHSASFAICERSGKDGFTTTKALKLEQVTSINRLYAAGSLTFEQALAMAEDVLNKLKTKARGPKRVFHSDNAKVLDSYWVKFYEHKENLRDKDSMRTDLSRAVSALGDNSLASASKQDMQAALKKSLGHAPNLQRRACARLDQLLKFIGRDFTLDKMNEEYREINYCTHEELLKICDKIEDQGFSLLCKVAFYTGARLGECFALEKKGFSGITLQIRTQIDENDTRRATKNRKIRKTMVIESGLEAVAEWFKITEGEKERLRHLKHARLIAIAADKAFPGKKMVFHDLRHSYAIDNIERGVVIDMVAKFLGNSPSVCYKYYDVHVATDVMIDVASKIRAATEKLRV